MEENINEVEKIEEQPATEPALSEESSEESEHVEPEAPVKRPVKTQEDNMRALREAKERAEQDREELLARVKQYENKQEESTYGDDDLIEGKHLKKEIASVRKQLKNYEAQVAQATDETRLKTRFPDFDGVVTQKALESLREADPESLETIAMSQSSLYSRGVAAYKRIKELGIYVEDNFENERASVQKNSTKPKPVNSISSQQGASPLSQANAFANGLTPELQQQLRNEMEEAIKRR